jgi:transposase
MASSTRKAKRATGAKELRGGVVDILRELLADDRDEDIIALVSKLVSRNQELELLLGKMRESKNRGERVSRAQLDLFLAKLGATSDEDLAQANRKLQETAEANGGRPEATRPPRQPAVRRPPPPGLRRVENPLPVPEAERPCPVCGKPRKCIAHETTEVIDLIPAEVIVRCDTREILGCDDCDAELVRAPMGDKVIEGGAYGSRLVGDLVVSKYWDGLPLYRQAERLQRLGLKMPSSSMADQITWATDLLQPIWRALIAQVLAAEVMHLDGTSLPVRDRDSERGLLVGSLWGYVGNQDTAVYLYTSTGRKVGQRPGEVGPEDFLALRHGYVVADAATLFDKSFKYGDRIEVGCNMHARRYFVRTLEDGDARAAVPIAAFQALYDVEDVIHDATREARLQERQRRSRPVYEELVAWSKTHQPHEPPQSLLGKAIQYLLNHQLALMRFLDDGILPIDNGIVERLHRRPAIGRRNFLFAGSHAGGTRAAVAYSVLATCALADVEPVEYLADVLPRLARGVVIARDIPAMLPAAWKAARAVATPPSPAQ